MPYVPYATHATLATLVTPATPATPVKNAGIENDTRVLYLDIGRSSAGIFQSVGKNF